MSDLVHRVVADGLAARLCFQAISGGVPGSTKAMGHHEDPSALTREALATSKHLMAATDSMKAFMWPRLRLCRSKKSPPVAAGPKASLCVSTAVQNADKKVPITAHAIESPKGIRRRPLSAVSPSQLRINPKSAGKDREHQAGERSRSAPARYLGRH
jgi:hypothetical protein